MSSDSEVEMDDDEIIDDETVDDENADEETNVEALLQDDIIHSDRPNIKQIINSIKKLIYDALFNYFDIPPDAALIASLLDPRFKKMRGWQEEEQERAISLLKLEYQLFKSKELLVVNQRNKRTNTIRSHSIGGFKSRLFGDEDEDQDEVIDNNEVDCYIDRIRTPQANQNVDPFQWWKDHKINFPILFKISQKYLGIPATSVPSERLFSDAGRQVTSERNRLKTETVNELLFVKRNREYYNPYD